MTADKVLNCFNELIKNIFIKRNRIELPERISDYFPTDVSQVLGVCQDEAVNRWAIFREDLNTEIGILSYLKCNYIIKRYSEVTEE